MNVEEYVGQSEHYFSESSGQMLRIDQMPFPHVFYSHRKLQEQLDGEYNESILYHAFLRILAPSALQLRLQLEKYGKASHIHYGNTTPVRSKFYHAGRRLGVKIRTHKKENWVIGEVVQPKVKLQGKVIS